MKTVNLLYWFVSLVFLFANNVFAYNNHGYPYNKTTGCVSSPVGDDYGFYQNNCTSYVAYVLSAVYGIPFNNSYGGVSWHDAGNWNDATGQVNGQDIAVDRYPLPGDVAYWEKDWTGDPNNHSDDFGHVAFVERVYYENGNAIDIDITEYNYSGNGCIFGSRNIPASSPSGFIHILAYNEGVKSLHYLDCYESAGLCLNQTQQEWNWIANKVWNEYRCKSCSSDYDIYYISSIASGFGGGVSDPDPTTPEPPDPDIHINSLDIRLIGGSYTKEIQKTLYWGQFFQFEGRAEFENRSSAEAKDIDADYRITDSRSNFNEDATKIDEDGLFNINPGEREENTINPITVRVSEDGTKVYYSQGSMTKSFDIINGFSKVYIFADIEVAGDKDISSPSDHDEYGKIELVVLRPPCQPSFTQTPTSGIRPLTVSFTNTSISNASDCTYAWSFGDGGTTNVYHPSYVYNTAGTYIPKLTASSYSYSYSTTKSGNTISITNPIPPSMMITNPTGSDNWRSDNTKHITWNMYNFPTLGNVRIDYTLDSGNVWRNIDAVTPNDGSRYWNMCNSYTIDSPNSYIRICSIEYGVCATSARFYIDHARGCK